jgi:ornithine carbamoyltransferase (EC 2.1.3.3)
MHLVDVDNLTTDELHAVLDEADRLRAAQEAGESDRPLADQTLAMIFEKPSTRTRVSFETGMTQLGGHAVFLGPDDIHLGRGEPLRDTARVLSRYADFIMARVFDHADVVELAEFAGVPVINGLSDDAHPCQTLGDLLTIRDHFGTLDVDVAWVGDGNNVCQSLALGAAMTDLDLTIATPEGYEIDDGVRRRALGLDSPPAETTDPAAAVADADLVYTDVWVSMGEEDRRESKLQAFDGFQVTADLLDGRPLMHCLPAHRGEEVTDEVIEGDHLAWDQAENRMHAQKGLLVWLAGQTVSA